MSEFNDNKIINKRIIALLLSRYLKTFILGFLLILFILSIFLIVKPKYTKMKNTSSVILAEKKDQLSSFDQYLKRLMTFNRSSRNITISNIESINKLIPENNDIEDLVVLIDGMVRNRNLSLTTIDIEGDLDKKSDSRIKSATTPIESVDDFPKKVKKISLKLLIEGADYQIMKNLISDFEKSSRLFDVGEINFKEGSKTITILLTAYYFQS